MKSSSVAVLELEQLVEHEAETSSVFDAGQQLVPRDLALFGHVNVRVRVEIGSADVSIERLMALRSGDVLTLDQALDVPVTLYVEERAVGRGVLVAVDDNFGVQITDII